MSDTTVGLFRAGRVDRVEPADRQRGPADGKRNGAVLQLGRVGHPADPLLVQQQARPEAGAAWDVAGDGQWKLHGSWGVFYDIFKLSMPQASFGGVRFTIYAFNLETYDWPSLVSSPDCPPACPGGQARVPVQFDPSFENIDPDLEPMRMQELTLGIEHQLSPHVAVSARFVHKQLDKAVEDIGSVDADGIATYVIGNPGTAAPPRRFPACPFRRPFAITMPWSSSGGSCWTATGRSRRATSGAAYTATTRASRNPTRTGAPTEHRRTFDAPLALFDGDGRPLYGRLATDRPHQAKAQFIYTAPFGVNVGVFQSLASGLPVSRWAVLSPGIAPVFYAGRGSDGRTPALSQTDLSVQYVRLLADASG